MNLLGESLSQICYVKDLLEQTYKISNKIQKQKKKLLIFPLHGYSKLALQYYLPMLSLVISIFYTSTSKYIHKSILLIINYIPSETHTGFDPAENNSQSPQLQARHILAAHPILYSILIP